MTDDEAMRDPFPNLDKTFARRVQEGFDKRIGKNAPKISWDDWVRLKPHLAAYKRDAEDARGYLNKGEAQLLRDISTRAKALLVALERAKDAGLYAPIAATLEPMALSDLLGLLHSIEEQFVLKGDVAPKFLDMSRANLFSSFEAWWVSTTGLPAAIEEGTTGNTHPTPFMLVANEVFNLPGMPPPTGASYKSLKDFRRSDRTRFKDVEMLADALKKRGLLE